MEYKKSFLNDTGLKIKASWDAREYFFYAFTIEFILKTNKPIDKQTKQTNKQINKQTNQQANQ